MADWAAAAAAWAQSGEGEKNVFVPPPPPPLHNGQQHVPQQQQQHEGWGGGEAHSHQMQWMPHQMNPAASRGHQGFGSGGGADPMGAMGHQGPPGGTPFEHGGMWLKGAGVTRVKCWGCLAAWQGSGGVSGARCTVHGGDCLFSNTPV